MTPEAKKEIDAMKEFLFGNKVRKMVLTSGLLFEVFMATLVTVPGSADALSFIPEFLWYKTCADSPPGFSPGCMSNVTVNVGERAVFNCQVGTK